VVNGLEHALSQEPLAARNRTRATRRSRKGGAKLLALELGRRLAAAHQEQGGNDRPGDPRYVGSHEHPRLKEESRLAALAAPMTTPPSVTCLGMTYVGTQLAEIRYRWYALRSATAYAPAPRLSTCAVEVPSNFPPGRPYASPYPSMDGVPGSDRGCRMQRSDARKHDRRQRRAGRQRAERSGAAGRLQHADALGPRGPGVRHRVEGPCPDHDLA